MDTHCVTTTFKTGAILSGLIYKEWPDVKSGLNALQMDMVCDPFDIKGSQGMLVLGKTHAYLVFRGTEASKFNIKNPLPWARDIVSNFGLASGWIGQGKAHRGYAHYFSYIRKPARAFAERIPTPIPLIVVGHSLGGCLATQYASWAASGGPDDHKLAGLITYGAPKCLNYEALANIACTVFRFTNRYDFAPYWPPILGLDHPEGHVKINSGGWPGPVSRHSVSKYINALP